MFSRLDITREWAWAATVAAAENAFGPVSVLVNNAGIWSFAAIEETAPAAWRQVIDVNLTGSFLGIRAVVPSMRKAGGGAIVNISSAGGMMAYPNSASYFASKWGMRGLTKSAALELGRRQDPRQRHHPWQFPHREGVRARHGGVPGALHGNQEPADSAHRRACRAHAAGAVVASDEASFSTGSEFIADGGQLLGQAALQYERAAATVA